ncbi:hypothetical protein QOT17_018396 [Balamuthia mandrillaris]
MPTAGGGDMPEIIATAVVNTVQQRKVEALEKRYEEARQAANKEREEYEHLMGTLTKLSNSIKKEKERALQFRKDKAEALEGIEEVTRLAAQQKETILLLSSTLDYLNGEREQLMRKVEAGAAQQNQRRDSLHAQVLQLKSSIEEERRERREVEEAQQRLSREVKDVKLWSVREVEGRKAFEAKMDKAILHLLKSSQQMLQNNSNKKEGGGGGGGGMLLKQPLTLGDKSATM